MPDGLCSHVVIRALNLHTITCIQIPLSSERYTGLQSSETGVGMTWTTPPPQPSFSTHSGLHSALTCGPAAVLPRRSGSKTALPAPIAHAIVHLLVKDTRVLMKTFRRT